MRGRGQSVRELPRVSPTPTPLLAARRPVLCLDSSCHNGLRNTSTMFSGGHQATRLLIVPGLQSIDCWAWPDSGHVHNQLKKWFSRPETCGASRSP